jgi:Flp pilus assembly protein TadG
MADAYRLEAVQKPGEGMGKSICRRLESVGSTAKSCALRSGLARGQSAAEFAAVSLLVFGLIFAVMDYSWIFFAQMNVQQALNDGGRFASTGNHLPAKSGGNESRTQSIIDTIQNEISVPNINVGSNLSICSANGGCNTSGGSAPAGAPGDTVTLSLTTSLPIWTPWLANLFTGGAYNFTAITTFKNEPFDPSNTN